MKNNDIKSEFQIGKNYIKEFNIDIIDKNFPDKRDYSFQLEVGISEINTDEKYKYANVYVKYNISLNHNNKDYLKIYLKSIGEFRANKKMDDDKFINFCKYNGTPMISQNVRAYLKAVTALSDLKPINLPMVNFYDFFEEKK